MNVLEKILQAKREALPSQKRLASVTDLRVRAAEQPPARGFRAALEGTAVPLALIAEFKRASPVKGPTRAGLDPVQVAQEYERAGAQCMSVLTDEAFFQGSTQDLIDCKQATSLPVLRKDFTVDEYHVWEARAMGADAVLLIVRALEPQQLTECRELAESLGMDALVEAHSLEEAEVALESGARLVGLNNRDLATFGTDLAVSVQTIGRLAGRATVVSESALHTREDVSRVEHAGARAVLIGTALCTSDDIVGKVKELMGW